MKCNLRVLHIITGLNTGGAEQALYSLLRGGMAKRFKCTVISLSDEGTMAEGIRALGVPVYTLNMHAGLPGPSALHRLQRQVRKIRPDVIQGWMYHGNLAASFAKWITPSRPSLLWNVRQCLYGLSNEKPLTRQIIRANRALSRHPEAIIYNSRLSRQQHETFGFYGGRNIEIPNGFDLQKLRPDIKASTKVRRELGISREELVIGHVARYHPMKDHVSFLHAAVSVARRLPQAHFLLIGRDVVPENSALSELIPQELTSQFHFIGEKSDVTKYMQSMDVLCSSSCSEAFPNVLGEAMACAVPCVATDVGECASIIGRTGLVVPPSDAAALERALMSILEQRTKMRRDLGLEARLRINAHYCIDVVASQYVTLYEKLAY